MLNIRKLNQSIVTVVLAAIVFCASAPHAKDYRTEGLINGYTADMYQGNGIGSPGLNEVVVEAKRENSKQDLENAQGKLKEAQDAYNLEKEAYEEQIKSLTQQYNTATDKNERKRLREQIASVKSTWVKNGNKYVDGIMDAQNGVAAAESTYYSRDIVEGYRDSEGNAVESLKTTYNAALNKVNAANVRLAKCQSGKECVDSNGNQTTTEAVKEEITALEQDADAAYSAYRTGQERLNAKRERLGKAIDGAKSEYDKALNEYYQAKKTCEFYESNSHVSQAAQEEFNRYCNADGSMQEKYKDNLNDAKLAWDSAVADAAEVGEQNSYEHKDEIYLAVSTDKGQHGSNGIFDGKYVGSAAYSAGSSNVFSHIAARAMRFLVGIKPIIYLLAGFGLIGFAFMAIFNKISWKWFSQIAIGLFLVANMGRFIEYFVYQRTDASAVQPLSYGDYLHKGFADTDYEWVNESTLYSPTYNAESPDAIPGKENENSKATRGFCQKADSSVSGWGGFTSCVKDIISTGKKAVDTVKTAQNTINNVKSGIEATKAAVRNVGDAVKGITSAGSLEGAVNALGKIGANVNNVIGTAGGLVNNTFANASRISNSIQDIGSSTDEVAARDTKRARGEGTNALDRMLKGQTVGANGEVERLYGGTDQHGNVQQGKIATSSNGVSTVSDVTKKIVQESNKANTLLQKGTNVAAEAASVVGNTSLNTITAGLVNEKGTINGAIQDKKQTRAEAERLRNEYAANTTPDKLADKASDEAVQAQNTATRAMQEAQYKQQEAEKLQAIADAAAQKAEETGKESDKLVAAQAKKRAELAAESAATAAIAAEEAQKPVADLQEKAREAEVKRAQYQQEQYQDEIKEAEKSMVEAEKAANDAKSNAEKLELEAQQAAQKAAASKKDKDIVAANVAAERARKAREDAQTAQKNLEQQTARRNKAELNLLAAKTREAELKEQEGNYKAGSNNSKSSDNYYSGSYKSGNSSKDNATTDSKGNNSNRNDSANTNNASGNTSSNASGSNTSVSSNSGSSSGNLVSSSTGGNKGSTTGSNLVNSSSNKSSVSNTEEVATTASSDSTTNNRKTPTSSTTTTGRRPDSTAVSSSTAATPAKSSASTRAAAPAKSSAQTQSPNAATRSVSVTPSDSAADTGRNTDKANTNTASGNTGSSSTTSGKTNTSTSGSSTGTPLVSGSSSGSNRGTTTGGNLVNSGTNKSGSSSKETTTASSGSQSSGKTTSVTGSSSRIVIPHRTTPISTSRSSGARRNYNTNIYKYGTASKAAASSTNASNEGKQAIGTGGTSPNSAAATAARAAAFKSKQQQLIRKQAEEKEMREKQAEAKALAVQHEMAEQEMQRRWKRDDEENIRQMRIGVQVRNLKAVNDKKAKEAKEAEEKQENENQQPDAVSVSGDLAPNTVIEEAKAQAKNNKAEKSKTDSQSSTAK